jgi:hypothetical protein
MNKIEPKFQIYETRYGMGTILTTSNLVNEAEYVSAKMTVISNINAMRRAIGLTERPFEVLVKKSYHELHEAQLVLIPEYNKTIIKP